MKKERVLIRFRPEIYECFELEAAYPVSYTHLTLPTICSV